MKTKELGNETLTPQTANTREGLTAPAKVNSTKLYKSVGYAYPTSQKAAELGFNRDGCWYLEAQDQRERTVQNLGAFTTKAEAIDAMAKYDLPVAAYSHR